VDVSEASYGSLLAVELGMVEKPQLQECRCGFGITNVNQVLHGYLAGFVDTFSLIIRCASYARSDGTRVENSGDQGACRLCCQTHWRSCRSEHSLKPQFGLPPLGWAGRQEELLIVVRAFVCPPRGHPGVSSCSIVEDFDVVPWSVFSLFMGLVMFSVDQLLLQGGEEAHPFHGYPTGALSPQLPCPSSCLAHSCSRRFHSALGALDTHMMRTDCRDHCGRATVLPLAQPVSAHDPSCQLLIASLVRGALWRRPSKRSTHWQTHPKRGAKFQHRIATEGLG
jgi:hypothetical protein